MGEFQFTHEAIVAAQAEAKRHGARIVARLPMREGDTTSAIAEMTMEQILRAAWIEQEKGDYNVADARDYKARLEEDIKSLRVKYDKQAERYNNKLEEANWAEHQIRQLYKLRVRIAMLLLATQQVKEEQQIFVEAWDALSEWQNQDGLDG